MERDYLDRDIKKFLNKIADTVGDKITEYHWREACELMLEIDEANPNVKEIPPVIKDDGMCHCVFPNFTWDSPMSCENCGGKNC